MISLAANKVIKECEGYRIGCGRWSALLVLVQKRGRGGGRSCAARLSFETSLHDDADDEDKAMAAASADVIMCE